MVLWDIHNVNTVQCILSLPRGSVISQSAIDQAYNDLPSIPTYIYITCFSPPPPFTFLLYFSPQGSVMSQSAIDQAYNDLLQQTEQFLMELQSRQEQQRVEEEEAEKLRKIKEEQVRNTSFGDIMMSLVCVS